MGIGSCTISLIFIAMSVNTFSTLTISNHMLTPTTMISALYKMYIIYLQGENLLAIGPDEVIMPMIRVTLIIKDKEIVESLLPCNVTAVRETILYCEVPELETSKVYHVQVEYGKILKFDLGTVSKTSSAALGQLELIGIGVGCGVFVIIVVVIIIVLRCRLSQTDQGMKKLKDKMNHLEMTVAKECKEGLCTYIYTLCSDI